MGKKGVKFTEKYDVATANIYRGTGDIAALQIPPPNHPLYDKTSPTSHDPIRVEAIDRDGKMTDPIEVWTDPDNGILWVLDGRSRLLDVREVNRRRKEAGREELVEPYIVPFSGDEKAAIARVREKNYHRRIPKPSEMAIDLVVLRKAGYGWDACAKALHHETEDAEQWGRRLLPLAHCIDEVRAALDAGEFPRAVAVRFAGRDWDGASKLGRQEQLALLEELRAEKQAAQGEPRKKTVTPKVRERLRAVLSNGVTEKLKTMDRMVAHAVAATLAFVDGDDAALSDWPAVAEIVAEALAAKKQESEE